MVQFWEFSRCFNDYFIIDCRGSTKGESSTECGSKNNDYQVINDKYFTCVLEYVPAFNEKFKL